LCLPFFIWDEFACLRVSLEGIGAYILPGLEAHTPVESFDERRAEVWHIDGQLDLCGRVRVFLQSGHLELDFAHLGLSIFAGEVFAGGNGSRCEGAGSQDAKQNIEISGVGGCD
jgi:hypothetical protein